MATLMYNRGLKELQDGTIDFLNDTIKVMAVGSGYTPNKDHDFIDMGGANDPVDARISGTTDQTLAGKAITEDDTNDRAVYDANDIAYTAVTTGQTITHLLVYKSTGVDTTSVLIAAIAVSQATNGGDINVAWAAAASGGLFYVASA